MKQHYYSLLTSEVDMQFDLILTIKSPHLLNFFSGFFIHSKTSFHRPFSAGASFPQLGFFFGGQCWSSFGGSFFLESLIICEVAVLAITQCESKASKLCFFISLFLFLILCSKIFKKIFVEITIKFQVISKKFNHSVFFILLVISKKCW